MSFVQDRILFSITWICGGLASYLGMVLSPEESRWFFVTALASVLTSGILSLGLKGDKETMRVVLGRACTSLLFGVFATYPIVNYLNIESAHKNVVSLGGVAAAVAAGGFIIGFAGLEYLMRRRAFFSKNLVDQYVPGGKDRKEDE